jgi:hypothetical protein
MPVYKDRLTRYGSKASDADTRVYVYWVAPETLSDTASVEYRDKTAAQDIAALECIIADLKEYRAALATRYAELETMPYTRKLTLQRIPNYGGKINYYVTITRTMSDGTSAEELREQYPGAERRKALARYAEMLKQYPGIDAEQDIARRGWERG